MTPRIPALARAIRGAKRLIYTTPFGSMHSPRYPYMFSPVELLFMCQELAKVAALGGVVGEVGCFRGDTSIFLNKYMDDIGYSVPYYAFDTFEGFTEADIAFESSERGKDSASLFRSFTVNDQGTFDETLRRAGCNRVTSRRVDANQHDFSELDGCSFCLIDMDLYRPVLNALRTIYPRCGPGAVIVVDDCREEKHVYDGAAQAYREFMSVLGQPARIIHDKLGIVQKPLG